MVLVGANGANVIPSLVVAVGQGEADLATATMSSVFIRGPRLLARMFTSGPKYDDCHNGWHKVQQNGGKPHPQSGTLASSQTLQIAKHACSACRCTCRRLRSDACARLRSIRP